MTDVARIGVVVAIFGSAAAGWALGGLTSAATGLGIGAVLFAVPWHTQPLWRWLALYLTRNRRLPLAEPAMVTNDRSGGGVRYQDGVAVAVVQILGRAHRPTRFTGSTATATANVLDMSAVLSMMRQSLGLTIDSASVVIAGARRRATGDYPRVYDSLLGAAPYAGQRETWLILRIRDLPNGDALRWRRTIGAGALAAAQRVAAGLRESGIRAKVATATDVVELEKRLGASALEPHNRRWKSLRSENGWLTTYAYHPGDVGAEVLAAAWSLKADGVIQNITVFPDGTCCAAVTVRTAQPPPAAPSVALRPLPGEQAAALANSLCGPRRDIHGQARGALPAALSVAVGPSGVLIGKLPSGDRLLLPIGDPVDFSRMRIEAGDAIAKRLIIRAVGAGERITVHTTDTERWDTVRMPHLMVTDQPRPAPGTTLSVTDGTVSPAPRPNAVIDVSEAGTAGRSTADALIVQTGPATVELRTGGEVHRVEVEFFRAENRYCAASPETFEDPDGIVPSLELAERP